MRRPSIERYPRELATAAREVALRLARAGHRSWIVGGSVRDLAVGRTPEDVDMTSAATPDEVEPCFEHVVPLGRAFGTLQLLLDGVEVEHTTFRSETGYSDSRRPTSVSFGRTLEEDSARRDFTCNALYLDPLTDELADPTGGLADLERGVLRTVGEPAARFTEDGLRLVRMARFAAALGLAIEPATWAAARATRAALVGVSVERALLEFERMFGAPGGARAVRLLVDAELLELLLPGWSELHGPATSATRSTTVRLAALEALTVETPAPGLALGFAVLLDPDPEGRAGPATVAEHALERLRPSRELRRDVETTWRLRRELERLTRTTGVSLAERLRLARAPRVEDAWRVARAFAVALGREPRVLGALDEFDAWRRERTRAELHPAPLLAAEDLARAGVPRDARFRATLAALETEQLDGRITTRDAALAWLAERARSL
ncbi:MAG: CCA tRNA nucleotidyltransferase [Planctomycetes bacterium]|nr:CCA tRNA nucleotidyltransferase [Planctomycetota bacterium]